MNVIVKQPYETIVTCETCGEPAHRRQADIGVPGLQIRTISYDTHAESQTLEEHLAAMGRMQAFHEQLFALIADLKAAIGTDEFRLAYGRITEIELGNVIPTACNPRSDVIPEATVRAFSREALVPYHQLPLAGLTKDALIGMLKPACEEAVARLKAEYNDRHPGDE
jgi:hypothetical protein